MKLRTCLLIIGLNTGIISSGQLPEKRLSIHELVKKQTEIIYDSLVKIRRDLHMNPELPGQEKMTSEKISVYLESLGLEVRKNLGGYGVVGILKCTDNGKKIAWRADIDAVKTDLPDNVDFKSLNPGIRHICGHDVHTVIGLGIASVLARNRERLTGTVYFIFQPSEENYGGAKAMIDDGLFSIISPDEIYGLHINPMPSGMIAAKEGLVYAYLKILRISCTNNGDQHELTGFIKKTISELQDVKSDSIFWDSRSLGDPFNGIASPNTIFRNYLAVDKSPGIETTGGNINFSALLIGTDREKLDTIPAFVEKQVLRSQYASSLKSVSYVTEYPTVINDGDLTAESLKSIMSVYGQNIEVPFHGVIPVMNDDFAYFQQEIPGVYYFLGGSDFGKGIISMPHSPDFSVDEECIKTGVKYFASMIIERLGETQ